MIFKILPKFKLRQEGQSIQFKDQVLMYNVKLESYVNFYTRQSIWFDKQVGPPKMKAPYHTPLFRNVSKNATRYEAFLAHYYEVTFKLLLHSPCEDDIPQSQRDDFLRGGDIIRLMHTELEGLLAAD